MTKITVQELHDVLNQALISMGEEAQGVVGIKPTSWEELSEEERAVITHMTRSTNYILSEFEVDHE